MRFPDTITKLSLVKDFKSVCGLFNWQYWVKDNLLHEGKRNISELLTSVSLIFGALDEVLLDKDLG